MSEDRVLIVGAGVGGLVAATQLAARGFDVTVLERATGPGGKLREVDVGGQRIDAGPTVLTMRWIFDEIFADAGSSLDSQLTLTPLDILARHFWAGTARLDLFASEERSTDAIGRFAGAAEARGYGRFCARARQTFETLDGAFMRNSAPSMTGLVRGVGLQQLPKLMAITPFTSLWTELGKYFRDARLQQLFGRYATYCGSSPFLAPATLMLIAHVERLGVWSVAGGMHQIAMALEALARRHGATFRYGCHVDRIEIAGGRACGVICADGTRFAAPTIVMNGDTAALSTGSLGAAAKGAVGAWAGQQRSLSAVTIATVARTNTFPLVRHSVFFSPDYAAEFRDLSGRTRVPNDPTVYVCAQDRADSDAAPNAGAERLFCIVNAQAAGDNGPLEPSEIERCRTATFQTLARCGLKLEIAPGMIQTTEPADFERLFPATQGALYGMASHGWRAAFRRPVARSRIPGLYLAGGSVHPGPGVPMAALSGRMAASRIMQDLALTRRSRRVAMPGGIWTR